MLLDDVGVLFIFACLLLLTLLLLSKGLGYVCPRRRVVLRPEDDFGNGGIFDTGIQVTSATNGDTIFTTLEPVDFQISQSTDLDVIGTTDDAGLANEFPCHSNFIIQRYLHFAATSSLQPFLGTLFS